MYILGLIAVLSFGLTALESDILLVKIVIRRRNSRPWQVKRLSFV